MTKAGARILIVDDEKGFCDIIFHVIRREGFIPMVANDGQAALDMVRLGIPDVLLLDVKMPGLDGMEVLKRVREMNPRLPVLMITAHGGIHGAVQAMKQGANDYLTKPLNNRDLVRKVKRAVAGLSPDNREAPKGSPARADQALRLREIMGPSGAVQQIISDVRLVAASDFTVVIRGETGTGKELIARAIHEASHRFARPMIAVDCGAIPETLIESELFGYEKGAFTGAVTSRPGKFEICQEGTLFLDEIANMPVSSQTKLLRAIQEKTFFRVGGKEPVKVDVRLLVATNRDLSSAVTAGTFSRDLFYRLSEFTISIPPLRERKEDIVHLCRLFLGETNRELNKGISGFSEQALQILLSESWPGNVRQLKSVVRRAVLQAEESILPRHLVFESPPRADGPELPVQPLDWTWHGLSLKEIIRRTTGEVERQVLTQTLRKTGGNKARAARLLQIDYKTIHSKVKQYGIKVSDDEEIQD